MQRHASLALILTTFLLGGARGATPYDCDFEQGFCSWSDSFDFYRYQWKTVPGGDPNYGTSPAIDASGSASGHFANIRVTKSKEQPYKARLTHSNMKSYGKSSNCQMHLSYSLYKSMPRYCINKKGDTFCKRYDSAQYKARVCDPKHKAYYGYMEQNCAKVCGIHCGQLKVGASNAAIRGETLFNLEYSNKNQWTHETINIPEKFTGQPMEITIEATIGWDIDSYIAVDNIFFTGCKSEIPRRTTTTISLNATTTISPSTATFSLSTAKIFRPTTKISPSSTSISHSTTVSPSTTKISPFTANISLSATTISPPTTFSLPAITRSENITTISTIQPKNTMILPSSSSKTSYDCDFEQDFCSWSDTSDFYRYTWKRVLGGNPNFGTGPTVDASGSASGHFANLQVTEATEKPYKVRLTHSNMMSSRKSSNCQMHFSYSLFKSFPDYCINKAGEATCMRYDNPQYRARVCDPAQSRYYAYMEQNCAKVCGINCGKLKVIVSSRTKQVTRFNLEQSSNEKWTHETISIPEEFTGQVMEVTIEATTGRDVNSYIAVDSISFTGCNFVAPNTTHIKTSTLAPNSSRAAKAPNPSMLYPDAYDCNFEHHNMCGWSSYSKHWGWSLGSQGQPSLGTGPTSDGSANPKGSYALMKVTHSGTAETAQLISPLIDQFKYSPNCYLHFQFNSFAPSFYHCYNQIGDAACRKYKFIKDYVCDTTKYVANSQCSKLCGVKCTNVKVYVRNDVNSPGQELFHIRHSKDNSWYMGQIPLGNYTKKNFQVVFEVLSGYDSRSYVAVDNIGFVNCETKDSLPTTTPLAPPI